MTTTEPFEEYDALTKLLGKHLPLIGRGKVSDSYGGLLTRPGGPKLRLSVKSPRASIYDFVLPFGILGKGEMLNAFNIAGRLMMRERMPNFRDDLVAFGPDMNEYLYLEPPLRDNPILQKIGTVVMDLEMIPRELIVRNINTGSSEKVLAEARKRSEEFAYYCGHQLSTTLREGEYFPEPLFTPTTKAPVGQHDEPLDHREVEQEYQGIEGYFLSVNAVASDFTKSKGVITVDIKGEASKIMQPVPRRTIYFMADELLTPDTCRFWKQSDYEELRPQGKLPPSMDKQILREWGKGFGIDKLNPESEEDRQTVRETPPPSFFIVGEMRKQILTAFEMLYGPLEQFHSSVMHIGG